MRQVARAAICMLALGGFASSAVCTASAVQAPHERFQRSGPVARALDGSIFYIAPHTRNLMRFDPVTGSEQRVSAADGLSSDAVFTLYEDPFGVVWIGTDDGIARFDGHAFQSFSMRTIARQSAKLLVPPALAFRKVEALMMDRAGLLWIGTPLGIYRFDGSTFTQLTFADGLYNLSGVPLGGAEFILEDSSGRVWFGSRMTAGVFCCEGSAIRHHRPAGSLGLLPLFDDLQGNLWFGSWSEEVYQIPHAHRNTGTFEPISLPGVTDFVFDLAQDTAGNLLIGSTLFLTPPQPHCPIPSGTTVLHANGTNLLVLTRVEAASPTPATPATSVPSCAAPIPVYVPRPFTAPDFLSLCR